MDITSYVLGKKAGGGGGGTTPTGTIDITRNGVIDVTNYASADVKVMETYYSVFTIPASGWTENYYTLNIPSGYTIDFDSVSIGIPSNSSSANYVNVIKAGLAIATVATSSVNILAVDTPTVDIQIALYGVKEV